MAQSNYDIIADEYYDERHVTSRNFDAATASFFEATPVTIPSEGSVLELGAGRGRSSEYLQIAEDRIVQLDCSRRMLRTEPREGAAERIVGDAMTLPLASDSVSVVTAFLFDPYNRSPLFREIERVLRSGGVFIGTLPHVRWGQLLREEIGCPQDKTVFVTEDGDEIVLDSILLSDSHLESRAKNAGASHVRTWEATLPPEIGRISEHIRIPAAIANVPVTELPVLLVLRATY